MTDNEFDNLFKELIERCKKGDKVAIVAKDLDIFVKISEMTDSQATAINLALFLIKEFE